VTPAPDHEGACEFAKVIVTWRGYSDKEVNLAAAYRDLDARVRDLESTVDAVRMEAASVLETVKSGSDQGQHLWAFVQFCWDITEDTLAADAIDAAHAGGGA